MSEVRDGTPSGGGGSGGFQLVRFAREIFPFLQSTQWVSLSGPNERERVAGAYDIVFAHGVLERVRRDAKRFRGQDTVGLFYGHGCECPWTRRLWLRVESVAAPEPPRSKGWLRRRSEPPDERSIDERLEALLRSRDPSGGQLLGWYRTRHDGAPRLTGEEAEAHARRFDEPWHFCVAIPTGTPHPVLGLFGRDETGRLRPNLLRPFYELGQNGGHLRHRPATPWNYRVVERAERPGGSPVWSEIRRRRAPAVATTACLVLGVAMGLALSYELSRANQPADPPMGAAATFGTPFTGLVSGGRSGASGDASAPADAVAAAEARERVLGLLETFERRVRAYENARVRPASAETYCEDLTAAYDGVHAAFVTLVQQRSKLEQGAVRSQVETAVQSKGRVDASFDASPCRR